MGRIGDSDGDNGGGGGDDGLAYHCHAIQHHIAGHSLKEPSPDHLGKHLVQFSQSDFSSPICVRVYLILYYVK